MDRSLYCAALFLALSPLAHASPDWSQAAPVPEEGNSNRYGLAPSELASSIRDGKLHAQIYPVAVTGLLPPYDPVKNLIEGPDENPLSTLFRAFFDGVSGLHSMDQLLDWLGLHPYPAETDGGVYSVPYPGGERPATRMGFALIPTPDGTGFTLSCATCHSSNLFGKTVLGLSNRFPRANESFLIAKHATEIIGSNLLKDYAGATDGEAKMYDVASEHLRFVGNKEPQTLGLDTSLAQVALSMARRAPDSYASRDEQYAKNPRPEMLSTFVADSKPAVWWDLKYKDRWLSDGSVVSGNPIYTNLLWNEIGRGADLHELEAWLGQNENVIRDLTSAVFSIEPPRITDFFGPENFPLEKAKRGQTLFAVSCSECHGTYDKGWDLPNAAQLPLVEQLKTTAVHYHKTTPVKDVGTDPGRYEGMVSLANALNPLAISKAKDIVIEPQKGYVPPPLVGIWARWPYFHNNSVPSLCALLTRQADRPKRYFAVEAEDPERDFDLSCNGYPENPQGVVRETYDATKTGMRNSGHDEGIFLDHGQEVFSADDKQSLIIFLQTL